MASTSLDEVWTFHTAETFCNSTIIQKNTRFCGNSFNTVCCWPWHIYINNKVAKHCDCGLHSACNVQASNRDSMSPGITYDLKKSCYSSENLTITQLVSDHNAWAITSSLLSSSRHEVHSQDTEILPCHSLVCWMNCNSKVTHWLLSYSLSSCLAQVLSSNVFILILSPICSLHQLCVTCFK
jgi:hypothetical protein